MMLLDIRKIKGIYLVCGKTDLRRGIDGLAAVVMNQFQLDPYSKSLYLFCGTRKDRFKALYWDGYGFLLLNQTEVERFLHELEKVSIIDKFDDDLFLGLVEVIEVWRDKKIVRFKDGSEIEV